MASNTAATLSDAVPLHPGPTGAAVGHSFPKQASKRSTSCNPCQCSALVHRLPCHGWHPHCVRICTLLQHYRTTPPIQLCCSTACKRYTLYVWEPLMSGQAYTHREAADKTDACLLLFLTSLMILSVSLYRRVRSAGSWVSGLPGVRALVLRAFRANGPCKVAQHQSRQQYRLYACSQKPPTVHERS